MGDTRRAISWGFGVGCGCLLLVFFLIFIPITCTTLLDARERAKDAQETGQTETPY